MIKLVCVCVYVLVVHGTVAHKAEGNSISHILLHHNRHHEVEEARMMQVHCVCVRVCFRILSTSPPPLYCNFTAQSVQTCLE